MTRPPRRYAKQAEMIHKARQHKGMETSKARTTHTLDSFRRDAKRDEERGGAIGHERVASKSLPWYGRNARGAREKMRMSPHDDIML